jgi:beta-N-acetylhexosaminidase
VAVLDRLRAGRGRRWILEASALAVLAAVSAIAGAQVGRRVGGAGQGIPEASHGNPGQRVSFLAKIIPPEPERQSIPGPRAPRSISDLARRLPLERKVAQLFLVGFGGRNLRSVVFRQFRRLDLGGILIDRGNYPGLQALGALAGEAGAIARHQGHVPPWVIAPQRGGELNALPDLPPAQAPGDLPSARVGAAQAAQSGKTLRAIGITGVLAPSADVGLAEDPSLGAEVFSDDPREVAGFAAGAVAAYRRARELSVVGHFPGLGAASQATEEGPAEVGLSLSDLRRRDLVPFRAAFRARAPAVLLSHALYSMDDFTTPGSLSYRVATDLLRHRLHFRGLAITDDLADPAISAQSSVPDAAVKALRAGADMLYISGPSGDQQAAYVAVLRAVRSGEVSKRRLDEAVLRILVTKHRYGLIR